MPSAGRPAAWARRQWTGTWRTTPGTAHNEARDQIWEQLLAILIGKHDDDVPAHLLRTSLRQKRELHTALNRAWPLIDAADLVADLWPVPAYLRLCAPWLSPDDVQQLQRQDVRACA
jgi:hypothetical protein